MQEFCNLGHTLIGCGRNKEKIAQIKQNFAKFSAIVNEVDVQNADEVRQWAQDTFKSYPQIDIIINNAGTKTQLLPLWEINVQDFTTTINTNIIGMANIIREFVPNIIKKIKAPSLT